jgi:hypothetical protein
VARRVDLDDQADIELLADAKLDQPVEDRLPVFVTGEIVVGDEEAVDALRDIAADDLLDVVGRAPPRLAALTPTSMTMPASAAFTIAAMRSGRMRVLASSSA